MKIKLSANITLNNLKYTDSADVLAMVQGERTKTVNILNTDVSKAKEKLKAGFGATAAQVSWEKKESKVKIVPIKFDKTKRSRGKGN